MSFQCDYTWLKTVVIVHNAPLHNSSHLCLATNLHNRILQDKVCLWCQVVALTLPPTVHLEIMQVWKNAVKEKCFKKNYIWLFLTLHTYT